MYETKLQKVPFKISENREFIKNLFSLCSTEIIEDFIVHHSSLPVLYYILISINAIFIVKYSFEKHIVTQCISEIEISKDTNIRDTLAVYLDARNNKNANKTIEDIIKTIV